jgi:hypothetical protein
MINSLLLMWPFVAASWASAAVVSVYAVLVQRSSLFFAFWFRLATVSSQSVSQSVHYSDAPNVQAVQNVRTKPTSAAESWIQFLHISDALLPTGMFRNKAVNTDTWIYRRQMLPPTADAAILNLEQTGAGVIGKSSAILWAFMQSDARCVWI